WQFLKKLLSLHVGPAKLRWPFFLQKRMRVSARPSISLSWSWHKLTKESWFSVFCLPPDHGRSTHRRTSVFLHPSSRCDCPPKVFRAREPSREHRLLPSRNKSQCN